MHPRSIENFALFTLKFIVHLYLFSKVEIYTVICYHHIGPIPWDSSSAAILIKLIAYDTSSVSLVVDKTGVLLCLWLIAFIIVTLSYQWLWFWLTQLGNVYLTIKLMMPRSKHSCTRTFGKASEIVRFWHCQYWINKKGWLSPQTQVCDIILKLTNLTKHTAYSNNRVC